jgi:SAM-dependent methyltransferase
MECNKICSETDWNDQELLTMINDVCSTTRNTHSELVGMHRKKWEWAIGMLSFKRANKFDSGIFLGIGSGDEYPIFYLTNHGKYVCATDLYSMSGKWNKYNAQTSMLFNPDAHAPYDYNRNKLSVQIMSGTDLRFEDNTFDGVFTYSSIEHFGGKENARKCIQEIERVLKPGGIASIATEIFVGNDVNELYIARQKYSKFPIKMLRRYQILNEMFTQEEFEKYIINATRLEPISPVNYSIDPKDVNKAIEYPLKKPHNVHIMLDLAGIKWSSIHVALKKNL